MLTPEKSLKLLEKLKLPKHIVSHSKKVAYVCGIIADKYLEKGIKIDKDLLISAAYLHDLVRTIDFSDEAYRNLCKNYKKEDIKIWEQLKKKYKGLDHSEAAYKYLYNMGEKKIALIVKKHRFDAVLSVKDKPKTIEEKIMTYADKRVLHEKIVSLRERLDDGEIRYNPEGKNLARQKKIHKKYFEMENEIFGKIDLNPDDIK
jgi:uncharacterized protein